MNGINPGVEFNFSFAEGATNEQILGFELAGEIWSQYLGDTFNGEDLDINIHVEIGDDLLPDNDNWWSISYYPNRSNLWSSLRCSS